MSGNVSCLGMMPMNLYPSVRSPVAHARSFPVLLVGAAVLLAAVLGAPATSHSQGGGATVALSADAFNALVGQLRKQQDQIAANQTKIETQLAAAKEEVRLARIAASRTGAAGRR